VIPRDFCVLVCIWADSHTQHYEYGNNRFDDDLYDIELFCVFCTSGQT
jgi:hypothetical protein